LEKKFPSSYSISPTISPIFPVTEKFICVRGANSTHYMLRTQVHHTSITLKGLLEKFKQYLQYLSIFLRYTGVDVDGTARRAVHVIGDHVIPTFAMGQVSATITVF
jgi:hypothetical protein